MSNENHKKFFHAWAEPRKLPDDHQFADWGNDWYVGKYRAPGLEEYVVLDDCGKPMFFNMEEHALKAAHERLLDTLNSARTLASRAGKPERYRKLTGPEFAELLREVDITPTFFAELYGTTLQRIMWWIDGANDKGNPESVPHPAYLLLSLMKDRPSIIDKCQDLTDAVTTSRRERSKREGDELHA